jgi:hypothetical protein
MGDAIELTRQQEIVAWLGDKRGAKPLPAVAIEQPAQVARFALRHFVRSVNRGAPRLSVARIAELLSQLNAPEGAWALGLVWLWPRRISEGHFRAVLARAAADSPASLMLRLFREAGGDLEQAVSLAGSTVRADPRSLGALHGVLLERAMIAGVRFDEDDWAAVIVPRLTQPLVWSCFEEGDLVEVLYGPRTGELRAPAPDGAELVERGGHRFWMMRRRRALRGPRQVAVCHPAELSAARRNALRAMVREEPFEQVHRDVFIAERHPIGRRWVTSFRDRDIEDVHLFSVLRSRGWRRGQMMDFGIFFEMSATIPELGWRPYVHVFPGIVASGPDGRLQYIHALAFQRTSVGEVPWGYDFIAHTAVIGDGRVRSVELYLDAPRELASRIGGTRSIGCLVKS